MNRKNGLLEMIKWFMHFKIRCVSVHKGYRTAQHIILCRIYIELPKPAKAHKQLTRLEKSLE